MRMGQSETVELTTGGAVFSSPVLSHGVFYVGSDDRHIYAFGLK